VTTLRVKNVES